MFDDIDLPASLLAVPRTALSDMDMAGLEEERGFWAARLAVAEALEEPKPDLVKIQRDFLADVDREIAGR